MHVPGQLRNRFTLVELPVVSRRKRAAFTLVEILVVIGIIVVLIAILMPALRRAWLLAQRTQCLSQMYQIGVAFGSYAAEYKGHAPVQPYSTVPNWADPRQYDRPPVPDGSHLLGRSGLAALLPYLTGEKRVFACPVAYELGDDYDWHEPTGPDDVSDTNYLGNAAVLNRKLSKVRRSAEVVYLQENRHRTNIAWLRPMRVDGIGPGPGTYSYWCWENPRPRAGGQPWGQEHSNVHENGGNLLFADGHAEYRKNAALRARDFGLTGGRGLNGTADDPTTVPPMTLYRCEWEP